MGECRSNREVFWKRNFLAFLSRGRYRTVPEQDRSSESGQIILVMAVVVSFVLLGVAAIAIDLGNGELQKRRLQNVADAAALAAGNVMLKPGATQAEAKSAAQTTVQ